MHLSESGFTQEEMLSSGLLRAGLSIVLAAPTGFGKTRIAEEEIGDVGARGLRAIYLCPVRALAEELSTRWTKELAPLRVGIFTGEYGTDERPYPVSFEDAQVLVMTPERLDLCTREWRKHLGWMAQVELLVVDELHTLADGRRGARLEGAVLRFMRLNPLARVLSMSATMGNRDELATWLGGIAIHSTYRPVPLHWAIKRFKKVADKVNCAVEAVLECVATGGQSLVFCQSRKRTEVLALALQEAGVRADFHHAGRSRAQRASVEARARARQLDCVVCTSTLGCGINLPARQVVLFDIQRWTGSGYEMLSTSDLWQRAGRAGRRGMDDVGHAVVIAHHRDGEAARVLKGEFEPVKSALSSRRLLAEQLVVECGSGLAYTRSQLRRVAATSLAALQGNCADVGVVVDEMLKAGMLRAIESDRGEPRLRVTRLGRVAVRQMVSPETVQLVRRMARLATDWRLMDVLVLAVATEDMGIRLMGDVEEQFELESTLVRSGSAIAGAGSALACTRLGLQPKAWLQVMKTAAVLKWACKDGMEAACALAECGDAEVDGVCEQAQRVTQAICSVMSVVHTDSTCDALEREAAGRFAALAKLATACLKARMWGEKASVALLEGVGPVTAGRLHEAGVMCLEDLALADVEVLGAIQGVGPARAASWSAAAGELMKDPWVLAALEEDLVIDRTRRGEQTDAYVMARAAELRVEGSPGDEVVLIVGGGDLREVSKHAGRWLCACEQGSGVCKHLVALQSWEAGMAITESSS